MTTRPPRPVRCPDCDPTGRGRECARRRCYCGHETCWAYDSWRDRPDFNFEYVNELNERAGAEPS